MKMRQFRFQQSLQVEQPVADLLDETLVSFTMNDRMTLRNACEGVGIFGSTGSGKTSGSGRAIADGLLRHGLGGVVLCVKPGDAAEWLERAKSLGRESDLIFFRS
ncbi:hypothetical protein [Tuwongella immobilis]|uniref:Helicase HerA central domain-containing protein n=1 Tax=Tuwongella immobilis TaxID=692036 RepID=A0A6C2YV72_9BACT|nr:hypothetical protein [Tuwongella immobilis]VIP05344.1 Uncharacterized protein OS=Nitrosospira multiformis (strain ATCC 25196 / NCIMB 11849) GN=Nmul_B2799 PE=4 SV=1 [Tuwongella immobilis]VTS08044.1 Uncharacterized protein OS=Nitrosospira multiformis (strain ATCC 25196 / NCIMB 11849) GN=Nmul_B2799 PE=4 SV=1 [Tuwongella immobilis]